MGVLGTLVLDGCAGPPRDEAMIDNFERNRAQFEKLRDEMCKLPKPQTVWINSNRSVPPLSTEALHWYREVMATIEVNRVSVLPDPCQMWLSAWAVGLGGGGDYKDYRFGPPLQEPMIEVGNLDEVDRGVPEITFWHRRIEGDWWLELEHWP